MLVRVWQELDYRIDICRVGIWNTCKVCRDTLSSGRNLSSMSAMVTHLQAHETPEGLLTLPVFIALFTEVHWLLVNILTVIETFIVQVHNVCMLCLEP